MKSTNSPASRSDLYIDESGFHYLGQSKYRYFILTSVVIDNKQRALANLLMQKWRDRYLLNPQKCFHAFEFFEGNTKGKQFGNKELRFSRIFNNSVRELLEFISYIDFEAKVFYTDLPVIRGRLKIEEPPVKASFTKRAEYRIAKNEYSRKIKDSLKDKMFVPLDMTIKRAFDFHLQSLEHDDRIGYVNIESNHPSDIRLINTYHSYTDLHNEYGQKILGLRLHNKRSLDAGIEIADLISYISCQTLRFTHKLNGELQQVPSSRFPILKWVRIELRKRGIDLVDISTDAF